MDETITVTIGNWESYKGRGDVKHNSWFRCSNRLLEDPDFYKWKPEELLVWIYIMSQASQKNSGAVRINFEHAERVSRLKRATVLSAIEKLESLGIAAAGVTDAVRARNADGTDTCATDRQTDKTGQTDRTAAAHSPVRARELFDKALREYPLKEKGPKALERFREQIKTDADFEALLRALANYKAMLGLAENSWRKPKQTFAAFLGTTSSGFFWRDFIEWKAQESVSGIDWKKVFGDEYRGSV